MTQISKDILERFQVRKTKQQKTEFIRWLQGHFPELQVEQAGLFKSRNLVLGDVASAKTILTAHYDTCARLPFPNFLTPQNFLIYFLYQLLILIPFFAIMVLIDTLMLFLLPDTSVGLWVGYLIMMALLFFVLMGGPANRHTANDNTSGVITLVEIYTAMTPEQRKNTALVFFDHEESGLLGSAAFAKRHRKEGLKEKLVLNFDCVSDGDYFLLVQNKAAKSRYGSALEASFRSADGKECIFTTASKAFYPSDQSNFPTNVAVAAFNKSRFLGLYVDKIHTKRDTVMDERNIKLLTECTLRYLEQA